MTPKERALAIARSLAVFEAEPTSENLALHHRQLWKGIHEQAKMLGLSEDDVVEIGQAASGAPQPMGGEPKDPPGDED